MFRALKKEKPHRSMTVEDLLKPLPKWDAHRAVSRPNGYAMQPKDFHWLEQNIPCQAACPAGTDIPGYLDAIARGEYERAYRINLRDNVFPAVLGRVCTRPCEPACRHGWEGLGEPVAICFSKRSADDFMKKRAPIKLEPLFPSTGKQVAVVGAGAAGLTVARELALWGHDVTVYERHSKPGGLMVLGIPPFRLPREILEREIEQIRLLGVDIRCGIEVGRDITLQELQERSDAVVMAAGTLRPYLPELPGHELQGVRHGLDFLLEANESDTAEVGTNVVVIGGGFTAVDCARTAHRLGADSVRVYYRRSEAEMYITQHEIDEMKREGIAFTPMVTPKAYLGRDGRLSAVRFIRTELGAPDADGRRHPVDLPGSEFDVPANTVLLGTGQVQDTSWIDARLGAQLLDEAGRLRLGKAQATPVPGLFVAGDFASGAVSLIDAIGHAKACARQLDAYLMGESRLAEVAVIEDAAETGRTREMDAIPRQPMPTRPLDRRALRDEVDTGYDERSAREEARRCYLCHYKFEIDNDLCIYCDRCLKVKPVDDCIIKVSALEYDEAGRITGYRRSTSNKDYNLLYIDQNQCIRCGACAEVCPVECIPLQKVSRQTLPVEELNAALAEG